MMMKNRYTPKAQQLLGRVLTLAVRLDEQPGTQAEAKSGGLSVQAERVFQVSIGTGFSYQGRLNDGGAP
jgi:hypothetical protein